MDLDVETLPHSAPVRIYTVRSYGNGFIALMPKPRSGDALACDVAELRRQAVSVLVSLLDVGEVAQLGLDHEQHLAETNGIEFIAYPITDRGVPVHKESYRALVYKLCERVDAGGGVVAHCWGGVGRSGLLAASVLTAMGAEPAEAFAAVSNARGVPVPETRAQRKWLERYQTCLALPDERGLR